MWFEDHPIVAGIIVVICLLGITAGIMLGIPAIKNGLFGGNKQVIDTKVAFHWAIIELGNGELLEGEVTKWADYPESDMIQVILDDELVILTHSSKILLCSECP